MPQERKYALEPACIYLRKSREDQEAESRGEGETLAKHKKALSRLAEQFNVSVTKIFEEIESGGERIVHRPEALKMLQEVSDGKWRSVFCMEIDRLGRGKQQDQGFIQDAFKESNTLIVTPRKIYDLNDEFDEEFVEFEGFMARKELKIITRRLQGGRRRSVEEGNYIGARPPYGYLIEKTATSRILVPHPEQAPVVQLIFNLYVSGLGGNKIAHELNRQGYQTYTGKPWEASTVLFILKNEVYTGRIQWRKKEGKKSANPDKKQITRTRPKDEWIDVLGKHKPIIDSETFKQAQDILKRRYHVPYQLTKGMANPLAGIIRCDMCGAAMVLRTYRRQQPHIMCYNGKCINKSTRFEFVENVLIKVIADWLSKYPLQWETNKANTKNITLITVKEKTLRALIKECEELDKQKSKLHDLLERGIYDEPTYFERSLNLAERISKTEKLIQQYEKELNLEVKQHKEEKNIIPKIKHRLKLYAATNDVATKNKLLKSVLAFATYRKELHQTGDNFELILHLKLPKQLT